MSQGIDIREPSDVRVRELLLDSDGAIITTGTATVKIAEVHTDESLRTFDFNDNTFKATAVTTETANLTHCTLDNATIDTGIWTFRQTTVGGFTAGNLYLTIVEHADLVSPIVRTFQWGIASGSLDLFSDEVDLIDAPNATALAAMAIAVWDAATRSLTDKAGFSLATAGLDPVTLPASFIAAGNIAAGALNGKGDWSTPTNVSDAQTAIINAVNAVNTGAARYISIATNAGYEIPDSGSVAYPIEIRTFDGDGEPVAIDSAADPTVTVTRTTDSTDLSGDLSAITSPATGVYRMTLTVANTATVAPLRIDASGAIATVSRSTSAYPVITDAVAVDFTSADRTKLNLLAGTDGATLATLQPNYAPAKAGDEMDFVDAPNSTAVTAIQDGLATAANLALAQDDLDTITDNGVALLDDSIKASTFDESTAFPLKSADTGATQVARTGSDGDTLETLSDEIALVSGGGGEVTGFTQEALAQFITDDTGETTAANGSVAKIAQGAAGGNVVVGSFAQEALTQLAGIAEFSPLVYIDQIKQEIHLVEGDDYLNADDRALVFTLLEGESWPLDLSSLTSIQWAYRDEDDNVIATVTGAVSVATGSSRAFYFDIAASNLPNAGTYFWDVQFTDSNAKKWTPRLGRLRIIKDSVS